MHTTSPWREQSTMDRRKLTLTLVLVLVLGAVGVAMWMAQQRQEVVAATEPVSAPRERAQPAPLPPGGLLKDDGEIDPGVLEEAARGEFGLELRNRVCRLCEAGALESEGCAPCRVAEAGRVNLDVVGSDGRPFREHEVMVRTSCGPYGSAGSAFLDLPEGRCELTATRVAGPFDVTGPPVVVDVVVGEEAYVLLEIPSDPWGGVGVTLRATEYGIEVEGLLRGTSAAGMIPEGAILLEVAGEEVGDTAAREVGNQLAGPVGSEVEVRFGWEGPDGWVEESVTLERRGIEAAEVSITAGAPG